MKFRASTQVCRRLVRWVLVAAVLAAAGPVGAQGRRSDYGRAAGLRRQSQQKVFRYRVQPNWFADGKRLWYRVQTGPDRHEFVRVDAVKGTRGPAFDHGRLAAAMARAGLKGARPDGLAIDQLSFDAAGESVEFRSAGTWWRCSLKRYELVALPGKKGLGNALPLQPVATGPRASSQGGAETEVTFVNDTKGPLELFWLDGQGERRSYGEIAAGQRRAQHTFAGHVWLLVDAKGRPMGVFQALVKPVTVEISARATTRPAAGRRSRTGRRPSSARRRRQSARSPDGRWEAFFKDRNVWARKVDTGEAFALSTDGTAEDGYEDRLSWSPDSTKLVAVRVRKAAEHTVHFIESSPRDQVQPKLHSFSYRKPGDQIPIHKPHLFDVPGRKPIPVSDELFANPWRIRDIRWARDSRRFTFIYNQRGHQALRMLAVDAATGSVRPIIDEKSETFIHYSGKYFLHYLDKSNELIWMSERDGWNHLYLYDAAGGKVIKQITKGKWLVRGVDRVDAAKRQIWFRAGGIRPKQDPYYIHYCRINFDGTGLVVLTAGDGTHKIEYSPDKRFFVDSYSRVDSPPVTELRRSADGKLICLLERADWGALLGTGWKPPLRFVAKGRDGKTDIYGVIYRPVKFDPRRKYPVIETIYAGPHGSYVPKAFRSHHGAQSMAELGFILVRIDGMGTSNRSKKFHDVCWKNLADSGLPDRVLWIKAAAAKYPFMDVSRVGIYGGSAGGQSAACAVMTHGDFYKVAVADSGCYDNRMDKIWWNEQWMGWPVGPEYEASSAVTLAPKLQGKLLLIVGEMDRNVDPASTMQVVNALIKADKDFDMLIVPGAGHGAVGTPYGRRRQRDFFVRHLLGVEPRSQP